MSEEFRNNQDENLEENGSVYHYNYINSESGNLENRRIRESCPSRNNRKKQKRTVITWPSFIKED